MLADPLGYAKKKILVTGCASGIGGALSALLLELGAEVYGIDRQSVSLPLAGFYRADYLDLSTIDKALSGVPAVPDALFNCVGLGPDHADADVLHINYFATRYLTQQLAAKMAAGSAIATVASIGGAGWAGHQTELQQLVQLESWHEVLAWYQRHAALAPNAYSLSKEAIIVWTRLQSLSLMKRGIRINCTSPGAVRTPMLDEIESNKGSPVTGVLEPIGRCSSAEEQAWALLMLNSERSSYINGVDLAVDGGAAVQLAMA